MKYRVIFIPLFLTFFLFGINTSLAEELDLDSLKSQQQELQSILNEAEKASQQRTQQNLKIKQLKHQLECNWTLIRSYETCGQLHKSDPKEHLNCSTKAKRNVATCLAADVTK